MENARKNDKVGIGGNGVRIAALIILLAVFASGCSVIDSIDRQLAEWGVVETTRGADIDSLAVVQVVSGSKVGVGVLLDGSMVFTANHVVKDRNRVVVRTNGYFNDVYYQTLEARVVYRNRTGDQALLTIVDTEALEHTVELGKPAPGSAQVLPLRAVGRSAFGSAVKRAVVKWVEITVEKNRIRGDVGIRHGDSGSPIVQDGKVVGLVRGASLMVASDVLENYHHVLRSRERKLRNGNEREERVAAHRVGIDNAKENRS